MAATSSSSKDGAAAAQAFWKDNFGTSTSVSVDGFVAALCSSLVVTDKDEARIISKFILGEATDELQRSIVVPYMTLFGSPQNSLGQLAKNLLDESGCVIEGFLGTIDRAAATDSLRIDTSTMNYFLRFSHNKNTFILGYERSKPATAGAARLVSVQRPLRWNARTGKWSEDSRKGVEFDSLIECIEFFRQSNMPVASAIHSACRVEVPLGAGLYAMTSDLAGPAEAIAERDEHMGAEAYLAMGGDGFDDFGMGGLGV